MPTWVLTLDYELGENHIKIYYRELSHMPAQTRNSYAEWAFRVRCQDSRWADLRGPE